MCILGAVILLCVSALAAALLFRFERAAFAVGKGGALISCAAGILFSVRALIKGVDENWVTTFETPLGPLNITLDPLASFFLLCVFLVSGLAALYGIGYLRAYLGKRNLASVCAWFNVLIASMATVVISGDAVLFLLSWEVMSVSSFFLVVWDSDRDDVRKAGVTYLVASQVGVVFLFLLFVLFSQAAHSYEFSKWSASAFGAKPAEGTAAVCFLLAVAGFGIKAGFWPLHVWLPEAHPAAPTHVSAVMSGVMIKLGIYGLLRTLTFLGPPPTWWGGLLVIIGAVSGVLGVLHALTQHNLKRLLAYHSVENIGIITMGVGLGLLGRSLNMPSVSVLGFAGALLHTLNHGLFKGLLFQSAGSILHGTSISEIDKLGGLMRRMPHTGAAFLVGSIAISGLPPLNGFISEWLIYVGAFRGASAFTTGSTTAVLLIITALSLIGGLAVACFVKAFSVIFQGEPRAYNPADVHDADKPMIAAMWMGMLLCAGIGLCAVPVIQFLAPVAGELAFASSVALGDVGLLNGVVLVSALTVLLIGGFTALRFFLLRGRSVQQGSTWGCGYSQPTARMQYTSSSFADPVIEPFKAVFHSKVHASPMTEIFPFNKAYEEHLEDRAERVLFPAVRVFTKALLHIQFLQRSRVQLYLTYIMATLVLLLIWFMAEGKF
jgi:formate hydrogenlyase subunit 3/multisubunit Na+/H+ antiporter MnhD subunit